MASILIAFGLLWVAGNSLAALRMGMQHEAHVESLKSLFAANELAEYEEARSSWQWRKAVHAHGMLLSLVTVVVGILVPMMTSSSSLFIHIMGGLLICAPVLWSIFGTWFYKPLLGLGDFCFCGGIIMAGIGFLKTMF